MFCYNNYYNNILNIGFISLFGISCFYTGYFYKYKKIEDNTLENFINSFHMNHLNDSEDENTENKPKMKNVEKLKNALLSFALLVSMNSENRKDLDMNYTNFDGVKLPHFSGCNITNACFSYITDDTPDVSIMAYKQEAINKYLEKNLNTEQQVIIFFDNFADTYTESSKILDFFKGFYSDLSKKNKLIK